MPNCYKTYAKKYMPISLERKWCGSCCDVGPRDPLPVYCEYSEPHDVKNIVNIPIVHIHDDKDHQGMGENHKNGSNSNREGNKQGGGGRNGAAQQSAV